MTDHSLVPGSNYSARVQGSLRRTPLISFVNQNLLVFHRATLVPLERVSHGECPSKSHVCVIDIYSSEAPVGARRL